MRYNDAVDGTNVAEEVVQKYRKAWEDIGLVDKNGLFKLYVLSKPQPSASYIACPTA